jgi:hypothetical protein
METFAELFSAALTKKRLTDKAAARAIGCTPSCIRLWRIGQSTPNMCYAVKIHQSLNLAMHRMASSCERSKND